jgi:radical SAM superfamily enzyme YgiQ (UPF0313 family)
MPIIEPAIRPPSEGTSFLLQVTLGCSSNGCTFCGAYLNKPFKTKDISEIDNDIAYEARVAPQTRRVFLMDGDALALSNEELLPILKELQARFPALSRISAYANGYNITRRSGRELADLYENKLRLIYMGLESGSQEVLNLCNKRSSVEEMVTAVNRAQSADIKASVIVLLGLGGRDHSKEHIAATITALNKMQPRYLSFLSLMVVPGTKLHKQVKEKKFQLLDAKELLQEAYDIISGLELNKTIFRSDHASNHLALEGRLPHDKEKLLVEFNTAIQGALRLRPEFLRGL